jgi:hypothetical protein
MKSKPITPFVHGIIDYAFAVALFSVPAILKLNESARKVYAADALAVLLYSAFTNYSLSFKKIIPLSLHKKLDYASLAIIALETSYKKIKKDKRAVILSSIMITAGLTTIVLTDWDN